MRKAIKELAKLFNENHIAWAVVGTGNLALHGMDVSARDVDIIIKREDIEKAHKALQKYSPTPVTEKPPLNGEPAWATVFLIDGMEVDVFSQRDTGQWTAPFLADEVEEIDIDRVRVPCLTLAAEAQANDRALRHEKAQRIRAFLDGAGRI